MWDILPNIYQCTCMSYINKYEPWNFVDYKATDWLFPHALRKCLKSHLKCYFDIEDKGGMRFVEMWEIIFLQKATWFPTLVKCNAFYFLNETGFVVLYMEHFRNRHNASLKFALRLPLNRSGIHWHHELKRSIGNFQRLFGSVKLDKQWFHCDH